MKRDVFIPDEEYKQNRLAKPCNPRPAEVGSVLCHDSAGISVSNDPTKNKIKTQDLMQKKSLGDYAKVYSARRNESAITF